MIIQIYKKLEIMFHRPDIIRQVFEVISLLDLMIPHNLTATQPNA
jgi:hypothetical protein